jgi:hypothetical protein
VQNRAYWSSKLNSQSYLQFTTGGAPGDGGRGSGGGGRGSGGRGEAMKDAAERLVILPALQSPKSVKNPQTCVYTPSPRKVKADGSAAVDGRPSWPARTQREWASASSVAARVVAVRAWAQAYKTHRARTRSCRRRPAASPPSAPPCARRRGRTADTEHTRRILRKE